MSRHFATPYTDPPHTQLMATGDYAVMLTATGAGYSRWRDLAVTRWREDGVRDENGSHVLLRDIESGALWSASWQPLARVPDRYEVEFGAGQAQFRRTDGALACTLDVAITPEGDGELRRITLHNTGDAPRSIELASWVELILGSASADAAHPAFSKMFVQTAQVDDGATLLAWRRKRDTDDPDIFAAHLCTSEDASVTAAGFETDRARFIGRCRDLRRPAALDDGALDDGALVADALVAGAQAPGSVGTVLDPIFCLRRCVSIAPGATVRLVFWTVLAESRAAVLDLAARCREPGADERAIRATSNAALARLRQAGLEVAADERFQRLATPLLYADPSWRAPAEQLARARGGPPALWAHAVSGDRPIVLVRLDSADQLGLVHELLAAQRWWRAMQLAVDLVVVAARGSAGAGPGEGQGQGQGAGPNPSSDSGSALGVALDSLSKEHPAQPAAEKGAGGLFVLHDENLSPADRDALAAAARIVMDARHGDLAAQLARVDSKPRAAGADANPPVPANAEAGGSAATPASQSTAALPASLEFFNGLGGFADDGREYAITLSGGRCTPMPWVNIVANAEFGFMVSAEGGGYTWSINSQTNPLTPWSNDPTRDPPGDLLYLRDTDSGKLWTATPEPMRAAASYRIAHGRGYTRFEHEVHGITVELVQFVAGDDPVKVSRLRLRNASGRTRRLQVSAYVEWALGAIGSAPAPFVTTGRDPASGALTARNTWRAEFADRIAFADLGARQTAWTCDRQEFLGRHGSLARPAALTGDRPLAKRCGTGIDPCAVLQANLELAPDGQEEIVFLLGETTDLTQAQALLARYRGADLQAVLDAASARWADMFDALRITTPDRRLDLLVNGWLPYQVLSCRVHARTAFYQASGAWGFRDQLQDVLALTLSQPQVTRAHLLRAAGRQFVEGDVQHWWLPPTNAGVRTHIADDRLWLPYAVAHYVEVTGDAAVLDEDIAFLEGPPLPPERVDNFFVPKASARHGSLFEHCARALEASLAVGVHGLPLFGSGDWNDGMNRVGHEGRGESVWMAWFLHLVLTAFSPLADARGEKLRGKAWREHAAGLAKSLDAQAWDGDWWKRGWYDDGTVLGSHTSAECRIDSIAQSWGVISQAADGQRARQAMAALDRLLVRRDARLIELFTPPFEHTPLDPGYIKGYPPGIRENGGQYTHGAVWAVIAFAIQGDGDRAAELLAMLNPISHSASPAAVARYQVEPYVACADVYTAPDKVGRGGWTWYTGTAGWLYRATLEWLLGVSVRGASLRLDPCIPKSWPGFDISLRYRSARYLITVKNPNAVCRGVSLVELDGVALHDAADPIPLSDDGTTHRVRIMLG